MRIFQEPDAEWILRGELINYRKDPLRYTGTDDNDVAEYRVNLTVKLKLYTDRGETLLWEVDNFTGDATYFIQQSESAAITKAVEDLARRIVNRVIDVW